MRKALLAILTVALLFVFIETPAFSDNSNSLLKGIGKKDKKKKNPTSIGLLERDELRARFKDVMTAYFKEDLDAFTSEFPEKVIIAQKGKRRGTLTKAQFKKWAKRQFRRMKLETLEFDQVFDVRSPSRFFLLTGEQLDEKIPVWSFSIQPREIRPFVKDGDYLTIANTAPDIDVALPMTMYIVFRKIDKKFVPIVMY